MRFDFDDVAGGEHARRGFVGKAQPRGAGQQQHPFGFRLVVPEAGRARLAEGDDALDPQPGAREQRVDRLGSACVGERRKQVHADVRSSATRSQWAWSAAAS
jgi:hypothetical protein